jgi:hypothetical protein
VGNARQKGVGALVVTQFFDYKTIGLLNLEPESITSISFHRARKKQSTLDMRRFRQTP